MTKVYHFPDIILDNMIRSANLLLRGINFTAQNSFTGFQFRTLPTDIRWTGILGSEIVPRIYWSQFESFYHRVLRDGAYFTFYDPGNREPQGKPLLDITQGECKDFMGIEFSNGLSFAAQGEPLKVASSAPEGDIFVHIKGLLGQSLVFEQNDTFSIHHVGQTLPLLYSVVRQAVSDGTLNLMDGETTVEISPPLRYPIANNDPISVYKPRSIYQFATAPQTNRVHPLQGSFQFSIIEVPEVVRMANVTVESF